MLTNPSSDLVLRNRQFMGYELLEKQKNDVSEKNIQVFLSSKWFFILLVISLILFAILMIRVLVVRNNRFLLIAKLLTDSDQSKEGSFGWYQEQLENNLLGKAKFKDEIISRFGFQDEAITSKNWFYYFRTFSPKTGCLKQSSCEIYAEKPAGEII